ncbi:UNVERIFIED_CONTAM: hypothetical protein Slati_4058200 [Sesamum latifolium]|uniref:Plant bHLH transcription factor ACT-like domain-containing protein n=1 Tax=Sesamum latifolium TaxID=2727402 RepID=A0AAW2TR91_9LAMI
MGSRLARRMALRRKLHILRTLTKSKSVKKSGIIMDAFLYIYKLKLQVEAIQREYQYLLNHIQEVKVEKVVNDDMDGRRELLMVRVRCKNKGDELLVSMLEVFERMNVNVVEARVTSCNHFFGMEAIVDANNVVDAATILHQAILHLLQTQNQN